MHNRKRTHYTESKIYPFLKFEHFDKAIFIKARNLIRSNNASHPSLSLDDRQLLEKAGFWRRDFQTGEEGYTLAAALLFSTDLTILNILPHYKTDALLRVKEVDRFDDRLYIQDNLITAYEKLMSFVEQHLPDKFFMEGDQRVSLKTKIFREIIANMLAHREYMSAYPASLTIFKD